MLDLLVNDKKYTVDARADETLLNVLRNRLDLTGTKYGCGEGACGACTVLLDGLAVRSCITQVGNVAGKGITTIEGLEKDDLHPVQKAFLDLDVFQCSYCAPGMIMSVVALLEKNPNPTEQEILKFMQGNICRCGTHTRIIRAIQEAAHV